MAIYSLEKYENDIVARREKFAVMATTGISSLQRWAKDFFDTQSPPFVRRTIFQAPTESDTLIRLLSTIDVLKRADVSFDRPEYVDVSAEWVFPSEVAAQMSSSTGPVIFYVHGGGFIYGSPGTARRATRILAALTGGRCLAVQYRLATEQPFPAQILDLLVVYFSILSSGIPSSRIVFAGESSGLSLLMATIQVLLRMKRQDTRLQFQGRELEVQLPVAVAGISGYFDVTNGLPSWAINGRWDVLSELEPTYSRSWKDQDVWPADPPRADVYCERSSMSHPLVSPVTAEDWRGAPPMFIAVGDERVTDANLYLAQTAARHGVCVQLERWEHMTHCWPAAFPHLPHSKRVLEHWAKFGARAANGDKLLTQGRNIDFEAMSTTPFDVLACTSLAREELMRYTYEAQEARLLIRRREARTKV